MKKFTLAIINPPYGVGGNLAIKFLNKLSEHTDDIRAVLPTSVRKPSCLNKIVGHLHCDVDEDLDPSTFPGGISAVKQHWKVKNTSGVSKTKKAATRRLRAIEWSKKRRKRRRNT